jgi:hypothetical protein
MSLVFHRRCNSAAIFFIGGRIVLAAAIAMSEPLEVALALALASGLNMEKMGEHGPCGYIPVCHNQV